MTSRRRWFIIAIAVALAAVAGASALAFASSHNSSYPGAPPGSYSNGPFQVGNMMGGWSYVEQGQLSSISVSQPVSAANGTLTYAGGSVRILVLMGPMTEGESMYSFVIDNFTNPTLVFPQGTRVTMVVANVDTDAYHGLTLTTLPPPYPYNAMPTMMSSWGSTGDMPPSSSSGLATQQISFTVGGEMYYLCPVPGHAQLGMYGLIRPG